MIDKLALYSWIKYQRAAYMMGEYFREWKSFSHQSRYSLSQGIIKSFYIVGLTSILSYCSVSFLRINYDLRKDKSLYNLQHIDDLLLARESHNPLALLFLSFTNVYSYNLWKSTHQLLTQSTTCYPYFLQMTTFHHIELLAYPFFDFTSTCLLTAPNFLLT